MGRAGWAIVLCAAVTGVGCERLFTWTDRPVAPAVARSLAPVVAPEGLFVESVLLERPAGDAFLDRDLWTTTLSPGSPETRALLTENGLRTGVLIGALPTQFQTLLDTSADVVDPHATTFNLRKDAVIPTAGPIDLCKFAIRNDLAGKPTSISLKDARCGVLIRPQPAADGMVKVWCEPRIQHGTRREWFRANEDGTQLAKFEELPVEKYAAFGFEVALRADECLVIGWSADQPETLGSVLFGVEADGRARQRVLVIRVRQTTAPSVTDLPPIAGPGRRPITQPAERK